MAIAVEKRGSGALGPPRAVDATAEKSRLVVWFAALGVVGIGIALWTQVGWILSDDFRRIGTGATPVPSYMEISARIHEVIFTILILGMFYYAVVRPKRRSGKLSIDGLMFLGFLTMWWQDPIFSYVTSGFNYSSVWFNMGGWAGHIPGWSSPNGGNIPEPLIWDLGFYVGLCLAGSMGFSAVMRRWKGSHAATPTWKMLSLAFIAYGVLDFLLEFLWVRTGLYHYGGAVDGLNIFPSRFYQFPMYEPVLVAVLLTGFTSLRYFVNDRGETVAERGIDRVRVGSKGKTFVRFLAFAGILNLIMFFGYSIASNVFQVNAGSWNRAVQERSYFTNGVCGAGTEVACPGPDVATPRVHSVAVGPEGKLTNRDDVPLPQAIPFSRERK